MTYWKDNLLVGVEKIDKQHRYLVQAVDNLMDACAKGQGRAAIAKTLDFVAEYTKEHFADEEKIQAQYGYPGLNAHRKLHMEFVATVSGMVKELEQDGPNIALMGKINKALVEWLIKHISIEDKKLGEFINSKGGK